MYSGVQALAQNTPPREVSPSPRQRTIEAQSTHTIPSVMQIYGAANQLPNQRQAQPASPPTANISSQSKRTSSPPAITQASTNLAKLPSPPNLPSHQRSRSMRVVERERDAQPSDITRDVSEHDLRHQHSHTFSDIHGSEQQQQQQQHQSNGRSHPLQNQVYSEDQNHDDSAASYISHYFQSLRPDAPIPPTPRPPTPHSQTAAPSQQHQSNGRSHLLQNQIYSEDQNHDDSAASYMWRHLQSPRSVIPRPAAPTPLTAALIPPTYPYPFSHVRRNNTYSAYPVHTAPSSGYDPNHPSVIEEQLALQMQIYALNHPATLADSTFSPSSEPFPWSGPFLQASRALADSTFSPSSTPYPEPRCNPWAFLQAPRALADSTFSPSPTPFPGPGYNPWTFLHASRAFGSGGVRPRFNSTATMTIQSSPSHQPVNLPFQTARGRGSVKRRQTSADLRVQSVKRKIKPPPRVDSTQPRDTSPEPYSSGEETAAGDERFAFKNGDTQRSHHLEDDNDTLIENDIKFPTGGDEDHDGEYTPPSPTVNLPELYPARQYTPQPANQCPANLSLHHVLLADAPEEPLERDPLGGASEKRLTNYLSLNTTVRNTCIFEHPPTTEEVLSQEIGTDENNHNYFAIRSFVLARRCEWDHALHDAIRSVHIQPSLMGYISQSVALSGKMLFQDAMRAIDLAFMFTDGDLKTIHLLLLVKAVTLFSANQHEEAIVRVQQLADACPNADTLACRVVEAYLRVQLGINALDDSRHNEAADHFIAAINSGAFSSGEAIHSKYEVFVMLFGWDLDSLWQTANQKRCYALLWAGRLAEAHEAYRYMMDMSDEATAPSCHDWSIAFQQDRIAVYTSTGDAAFAARDYDRAIELYSAAIDLGFTIDTIFASRCSAKLEKMLWDQALLDAQKVIELNPSSYLGHELKHAALHGAQRYDEAIAAFETMLSKLDDAHDAELQMLRQHYFSPFEAQGAIQKVVSAQMESAPPRLVNTFTGYFCDREAQRYDFETSTEYKELLSSTIKHANRGMEQIENAVAKFFRYAMLSHRWEGKEPLLHEIQDKKVYELDPIDGIVKLQSFCKVARDWGYRWAWSDTCCIDKNNNIELQQSINSMFIWYRHSALTIIYLSDVLPSSKPGALGMSAWISRGWTVQEFLAPKVVLFYQKDWTLYLDDRSPNHKESAAIMRELEDATGINGRALIAFDPGMRGAREKLQWASMRVTTLQEDIAYSLFGIFGVHLSPIYGENKQNALGRLLQEVIAQSGDITCLDWVGRSSTFNSCLPASITFYGTLPSMLPSALSEDEIQASVSSLRDIADVQLASRLYQKLNSLSAPRFSARRLRLPCITFAVTEVKRRRGEDNRTRTTFAVKADGLHDLLITTEDKLTRFSPEKPVLQSFLLVRPWDRSLLELPDFADPPDVSDTESIVTSSPPVSSNNLSGRSFGATGPVYSESHSRELRLIVRLGQPFSAILLAQQWGGEYKRIASDHNIIAQVTDVSSGRDDMHVRTLEIL